MQIAFELLLLLPGFYLGHPGDLCRGVLKTQESVGVECDADVAVAHKVLESLRIHACLGLIAAVGVVAYVRGKTVSLNAVGI